jgi:Tol biopolymer transport system component
LVLALSLVLGLSGCTSSPSDDGDGHHIWPYPPGVIDVGPRWCPDGTDRIAYTHYPKDWEEAQELGGPTVWVVSAVTGEKEMVASGWVYDWSPDGARLLCGGADDDIWFVDVGTGDAAMVLGEVQPLGAADLDAAGAKMVYFIDGSGDGGVWILTLDSMVKKRVCYGRRPSWHPNSSEILCDGLVMVGEDGTQIGTIPHPDTLVSPQQCRWDPYGETVAFTAFRQSGSGERVYVVGADGSGLRIVAELAQSPSWSPDGGRIAYCGVTDDGKWVAIWAVNSDGTGRTQITFP